MEPVIAQKSEMLIAGMSFYGDPFDNRGGWDEKNEIGRVWVRLMKYLEEKGDWVQGIPQPGGFYEVHVYNQDTITRGIFEVFVGLQVERVEGVPVELLVKTLPTSEYAVFTFRGKEIASDWHMQIDQWITAAGYQRAHPYSFQYYDQRFKGVDQMDDSVLEVYMPVKPT